MGLAGLIAEGRVEEALQEAKRLADQGDWEALSDGITDAFGGDGVPFSRFASLPRARQEKLLRTMLPYALQATKEEGMTWGTEYLLGVAIALDFPELIDEIVEELVDRGEWEMLSYGIADAFKKGNNLFPKFTSSPQDRQEKLLRTIFSLPHGFGA